jgi:CRP/FNR family transcriptional regulator, cyclic AMP receptor protein
VPQDAKIKALGQVPLFEGCSARELGFIASRTDEVPVGAGRVLTKQGRPGNSFYVILDGEADVVADGQKLATLARGDFFGEVSVLLGEPPTADIVATRPLRCIVLGGPAVESFLVDHPRVMFRMLQASARRLRNANRRLTANQ